ncbi:hypothetical protein TraAM80_07566 [Trypanosoma rangeli]|uniref:Uncharacterized protein n=1 Tax=Trypanosoma rangeli TaxID=5698 RepID=A0A3R7K5Y0_TRYRA|nr:uncharacterized protein TraAM80_07566 [Trypanosoma rangeli]RNF00486.1 hypothetical protein TraAM80_07566 [Trypanosoma rangeli]|eukprot:RNF00486.1 hypothetical protein TraAM80_07566 [Trypanosoma rangeli]
MRGGGRPSVATIELLEAINHAEERVTAAWTRVGLAEVDRQNKWNGFVEGRLRPFLDDYVRMQESEEVAIAAGNDRLFREMFFASLRLKELPRSKELAQLVEVVLSQRTMNSTVGEEQTDRHYGTIPKAIGWDNSGDPLGDGEARERDSSVRLPSFVSVVAALSVKGEEGFCSRSASIPSRARDDVPYVHPDHESRSPSIPTPDGVSAQDAAWAAFRQLTRSMTHQQLHRNLESEVERMNALADTRLQQLCLLYKQRALLRLSPQEQAWMRGKYAEKLLSGEMHKQSRKGQQPTAAVSTTGCGSCCSNTREGGIVAQGSSWGRTTACRSCHSVTKDELDLLSDFLPERLRVEREGPRPCGHSKDEAPGAESQEEFSGRETIFEVDLGDVTRFGRRQDLSLARIDAETQEIYDEIVAQNEHMAAQAEKELQCVEEVWQLFEDGVGGVASGMLSTREAAAEDSDGVVRSVPSRQEFHYRIMQMRREYEDREEAVDETFKHLTEPAHGIVGSNSNGGGEGEEERHSGNSSTNNNNSSGATFPVLRTTPIARPPECSNCLANISEGNRMSAAATAGNAAGGITNQLPAPLVKLFTTRSYAPILAYIVAVREELQRRLLQGHIQCAQDVTSQLTELYRCYFEKTRDTAYYVAPDYSQWLQENAEVVVVGVGAADKRAWPHPPRADEASSGKGLWQQFLAAFTPRDCNDILCERIAEVRHVVNRASAEANLLRRRLQILDEVEPLLQRRSEIIAQQCAIQEGSRDRLLSKKINMAKQLLFEENARRQFARELPKIYEQLEGLLCQWNETVETDEGHPHSNGTRVVRRLVLHGTDIEDIVRQFRDDAHARGRCGCSPPPTRRDVTGFLTPHRTPCVAHSITHHKAHSHHVHVEKQHEQKYAADALSPPPRSIVVSSSAQITPVRTKVHAAKKSTHPASSVSPVPVKRTALVACRRGVRSVPSVNEFLQRQPRVVPATCSSSRSKPTSASSRANTPMKK